VQAIRGALGEAGSLKDCDHRIADVSGEQYRFKEAALAITRLLRDRKVLFVLWHPADCIGEVGAATLPAMLAMLFYGARKDYLPGPVFLGHLGNDDDKRAAFIAKATTPQSLALEIPAEAAFNAKRMSAV
jgi:3-oxoacyl-[acyl-carrier-protein] synthase-1